MKSSLTAVLVVALLAGCADPAVPPPEVAPFAVPSGPDAVAPNLARAPDGSVLLSWTEPREGGGHALKFARLDAAGEWSEPRLIAAGENWFVNWADFPAMAHLADGTLVAHWLKKSGPATYAYDVMVARSSDGGATWTDGERAHGDDTQTEHGFVSLLPTADDRLRIVWLDGRETDGGGHAAHVNGGHGHGKMGLRTRELASDGGWDDEELLDESVCDCCQTAAVETDRGTLVAYRNRTDDEIRDIWVTTRRDGRWTAPRPLHEDGWHISGCPVNGPSMAVVGARVVAAWFTAPDGVPRVKAAFSDDGGDSFGAPVVVDEGHAMGRVGTALLDDGSALVSSLTAGRDEAVIAVRRIHGDGTLDAPVTVARSSAARASGFPRMIRYGDGVLLAWTEPGEPGRLRAATVSWSPTAP